MLRPSFTRNAALAAALAAAMCAGPVQLRAQMQRGARGQGFSVPVTDQQGRKSTLRGDPQMLPDGRINLTNMVVEISRGETPDLVINAPQCVYDPRLKAAYSSGPLHVRTANGSFSIEGRGFRWSQADSRLIISNEVKSLVNKTSSLLGSAPPGAALAPAAAAAAAPERITLTARRLDYASDTAHFSGEVAAEDLEIKLTSGRLAIARTAQGVVESIQAEENVVMLNKLDNSRATGDQAIFRQGAEEERIELRGNARWVQLGRESTADLFILDRRKHTLVAEGGAYLKIPRQSAQGSPLFLSASPVAAEASAQASQFIEVTAGKLSAVLPESKEARRGITAEQNVVVRDLADGSTATGDLAVYHEDSGLLELSGGEPAWESGDRRLSGTVLRFDLRGQGISASEAALAFPLSALSAADAPGLANLESSSTNTVEISAAQMEYKSGVLGFHGSVRAALRRGDLLAALLHCSDLTVKYSNRLESLSATGGVMVDEVPAPDADPSIKSKSLQCQTLSATFNAAGAIVSAKAEQNVAVEQSELMAAASRLLQTRLNCGALIVQFQTPSNQVERVTADQGVVITQSETGLGGGKLLDRIARGDRAIYTSENGLLELSGNPQAVTPEGRITQAERVFWDRNQRRLFTRGVFKSQWRTPPNATNQLDSIFPPSPK